jgi:hypothetical protein
LAQVMAFPLCSFVSFVVKGLALELIARCQLPIAKLSKTVRTAALLYFSGILAGNHARTSSPAADMSFATLCLTWFIVQLANNLYAWRLIPFASLAIKVKPFFLSAARVSVSRDERKSKDSEGAYFCHTASGSSLEVLIFRGRHLPLTNFTGR